MFTAADIHAHKVNMFSGGQTAIVILERIEKAMKNSWGYLRAAAQAKKHII